jgi:hypothetical protein
MTVEVSSEATNISRRDGGTAKLADAENISGDGVEARTSNTTSTTLYLSVDGAVTISVEVSPDGGSTWYVLPESPVKFSGSDDNAIRFAYDFNRLRVSSDDASVDVTAQLREVV